MPSLIAWVYHYRGGEVSVSLYRSKDLAVSHVVGEGTRSIGGHACREVERMSAASFRSVNDIYKGRVQPSVVDSLMPHPRAAFLDLYTDVDDSDVDSVASLPPFSPSPSGVSSHTSWGLSIRSGSPAPSVWSMSSSIRAQAVRQEFGRAVNNYSEVYRLPADEEELTRLGMASRQINSSDPDW